MPDQIQTAEQATEFLHSRIDYERMSASLSASDFKLDRMRNLLEHLGNPHLKIPVVHIAGTKGKGSTAAMVSRILVISGIRTGLFTSPHVECFEERIRINGEPIPTRLLIELVNELAAVVEHIDGTAGHLKPTFFELTTALGWLAFQRSAVQIAILEVGLGGRLDSTNLCCPEVCAITSISRDHTHILGSRLSQIAAEKAGIIKDSVPVVCGTLPAEAEAVIREVAAEKSAPVLSTAGSSPVPCSLTGPHQQKNAAVASAIASQLQQRGWPIPSNAVADGLQQVAWPARVEIMSRNPLIVLDAAHNWASCGALLEALQELHTGGRRILIFSTSADKDAHSLLRRLIPEFDTILLTAFQSNPRALKVSDLVNVTRQVTAHPFHVAQDPSAAWKAAWRLARPDSLICIAGSFFLAAELRDQIAEFAGQSGDRQAHATNVISPV